MAFRIALVDYDEDLFAPQGWEGDFVKKAGAELSIGQFRTPETALEAAKGADVVMVQSVRKLLTGDVVRQLDGCRGIIRVGIGYDTVDMDACNEMTIALCNVPEYCVEEVADHAFALLLAAVRHLARQDDWIRHGKWDRTGAKPAKRLSGMTLGLVGFGRVGRALMNKSKGMNWNYITFDPYMPDEVVKQYGAEKVSLEELMQRSDLVSVQSPLTEETRHLIGAKEFAAAKDNLVLVNTSRGPVIDEQALIAALKTGKIRVAGLDVFETEPLPAGNELRELDNVILTPHVAGYSEEAVGDMYRSALSTAISLVQGTWPPTAVNPAIKDAWLAKWGKK